MIWLTNGATILGAMLLWGVVHTALASFTAKAGIRRLVGERLGDGWYRLAYNIIAGITFLPVFALPALLPDQQLYVLPVWARFITIPLQLLAVLALLLAVMRVDGAHFLGLRQVIRWLNGDPAPASEPQLVTSGVYGWVRHPLYFFSLLFLWLSPVMTVNVFLFNAGVTLYFYVGSLFEEQKLIRIFGDDYRRHIQHVPRLLPWPPAWQHRDTSTPAN